MGNVVTFPSRNYMACVQPCDDVLQNQLICWHWFNLLKQLARLYRYISQTCELGLLWSLNYQSLHDKQSSSAPFVMTCNFPFKGWLLGDFAPKALGKWQMLHPAYFKRWNKVRNMKDKGLPTMSIPVICWRRSMRQTFCTHSWPRSPLAAALTLPAAIMEGGYMANLNSENTQMESQH